VIVTANEVRDGTGHAGAEMPSQRKRGRPPKFSTATAFELLVDEGVHRLRQSGYDPSMSAVNLEQAIRATEVPRGAAYRLWNREGLAPQEQYRIAVLLRMFDSTLTDTIFQNLSDIVDGAIAEVQADIQQEDRDRRRYAIRYVIRVATLELQETIRTSDAFHMSRSLARSVKPAIRTSPELQDAISSAERIMVDNYVDIISRVFGLFESALRSPFTFEHLIHLGNALNEGLLHSHGGPPLPTVMRSTGRNGEMEEWPLFAVGFEAMVAFFSTDPTLRLGIDQEGP